MVASEGDVHCDKVTSAAGVGNGSCCVRWGVGNKRWRFALFYFIISVGLDVSPSFLAVDGGSAVECVGATHFVVGNGDVLVAKCFPFAGFTSVSIFFGATLISTPEESVGWNNGVGGCRSKYKLYD
jgi:hypothetical protein